MTKAGLGLSKNSLGQFLNLPAVWSTLKVLISPRLMVPQMSVSSLSQLSVQEIQNRGIKYIVFDKDNTLCLPFEKQIHSSVLGKIREIQAVFPASRVAILSNSIGSSDDLNFEGAAACEAALGISVIRHVSKKPDIGCFHEVISHFERAREGLAGQTLEEGERERGRGVARARAKAPAPLIEPILPLPGTITAAQVCIIGDRVLTDIVFANRFGMHSILTAPLTDVLNYSLKEQLAVDNVAAVVFRKIELSVLLPLMQAIGVTALEIPAK